MDKNSIEQLVKEIITIIEGRVQATVPAQLQRNLVIFIERKQDEYYSDYFKKWLVDEGSHGYHQIAILKDGNVFSYEATLKDGGAKSVIIESGFETPDLALRVAKRRIDGDWT
jgi:hypothetical protein